MAASPSNLSSALTNGKANGLTVVRSGDSIEIQGMDGLQPRIPSQGEHDENIADLMDKSERLALARRLIEYSHVDRDSRKEWEEREKRAMEMMGAKDTPKDSDRAPGVHHVVHPMLMEASVQFQARAIAELFPPGGPVKAAKAGEVDDAVVQQGQRVEDFLNWYLTEGDPGYFADTDQMLAYLPMSGSAFRKAGQNWVTGLPELRYVKATDFIAPYVGIDLRSMPRYAHSFTMDGGDVRRAQERGLFLYTDLVKAAPGMVQNSTTADLSDQRIQAFHDDDDVYPILEYHVDLELEADVQSAQTDESGYASGTKLLPYIVVVETSNEEILAVRRNWSKTDPQQRKLLWFTQHKLLPGLGFYGWGLPHVIGSLQLAISGGVNALLDSGFAANFQGGFKTKSGKAIAGELRLEHGIYKDVDASYEDLSKAFFQPQFKEPSNALGNLVTMLVEAGRRFAGTMDIAVGDQSSQNAPVGTTLALIEQASKPQSAIHKRLHASFKQEFQMLVTLVKEYMPERYPYKVKGAPQEILKADFDDRIDIIPVSDPNIYSSTQRIAIAQGVLQLQAQAPQLYSQKKQVAAHRALLEAMRVPDLDAVAPDDPQDARYLDPVAENGMMFVGKAVQAFPQQDHRAHIVTVQNGIQYAQATMPDDQFQHIYPVMMSHMREHLAMEYTLFAYKQAGIEAPPADEAGLPASLPPDIESRITSMVVNALPIPPMAQQQQDEAAKAQDTLKLVDAKIQALNQETDARIQREDALAKAKIARDTTDFVATQHRQEQATDLDEARKDTQTSTQMLRDAAAAKLQREHQAREAAVKHEAAQQQAQVKIDTAKQAAQAKKQAAKKAPKKETK